MAVGEKLEHLIGSPYLSQMSKSNKSHKYTKTVKIYNIWGRLGG